MEKFREHLPILTGKGSLLKLKGKVHTSCVISHKSIYDSKTWPMKVKTEVKLDRNERVVQMDMWF